MDSKAVTQRLRQWRNGDRSLANAKALLHAYIRSGRAEEARRCFAELQSEDLEFHWLALTGIVTPKTLLTLSDDRLDLFHCWGDSLELVKTLVLDHVMDRAWLNHGHCFVVDEQRCELLIHNLASFELSFTTIPTPENLSVLHGLRAGSNVLAVGHKGSNPWFGVFDSERGIWHEWTDFEAKAEALHFIARQQDQYFALQIRGQRSKLRVFSKDQIDQLDGKSVDDTVVDDLVIDDRVADFRPATLNMPQLQAFTQLKHCKQRHSQLYLLLSSPLRGVASLQESSGLHSTETLAVLDMSQFADLCQSKCTEKTQNSDSSDALLQLQSNGLKHIARLSADLALNDDYLSILGFEELYVFRRSELFEADLKPTYRVDYVNSSIFDWSDFELQQLKNSECRRMCSFNGDGKLWIVIHTETEILARCLDFLNQKVTGQAFHPLYFLGGL